jgi:hypothetical protein
MLTGQYIIPSAFFWDGTLIPFSLLSWKIIIGKYEKILPTKLCIDQNENTYRKSSSFMASK